MADEKKGEEKPAAKGKYLRMLARAVPSGWIVRGNDAIEEDCFTQFSAKELQGLDLLGMGVKLHHKGDAVLGHVVEKMISDEDALLVQVEIPMTDDLSTPTGAALHRVKENVAHMIENGYLKDISLAHYNDYTPHPAEDGSLSHILVQKKPVEISVTPDGYREGSSILSYEWHDKPYLLDSQYQQFSPDNSTCKSVIDWIPEQLPKVIEASLEASLRKNNSTAEMADTKKPTPDDMSALLKKNSELVAELNKMKPVFEKAVADEEAKQKAAKEALQRSTTEVFDATIEILKQISSEPGKTDEDKAIYNEKVADLSARKERVEPLMSEMVNTSANDPKYTESFENMQYLLSQLSPAIMTCARYASGALERVEKQKQELLKLHQGAAAGASNIASTDAGSDSNKRPFFRDIDDYDAIIAKKLKDSGLD